ncbi:hypothetical protein CLV62_12210 [Dysgonomonas alginatilytica]|uniref:Lipoprotein n=1 Tax=Dysgonomonas alginatilytica TaxID=1605892 RepID=A0A2V3PMG0_9BACT|nr:hypothetical protein [Dysgonomonas alginatilytica]PXV62058.1 hypothetical protein CLV62_12210 [Dysgonomonas alginatilytica]
MKQLLTLILLSVVFISCNKEYKYEVYAKTGLFSDLADQKISEDVIKESNDSAAFVKAHRKFLINMQLKFDSNKDFHPEIYYFKLINPQGIDISSGSFLSNPNEIMIENASFCLSDEFKQYIQNIDYE